MNLADCIPSIELLKLRNIVDFNILWQTFVEIDFWSEWKSMQSVADR